MFCYNEKDLLEVFCIEEMLLSDACPPPRLGVAAEDLCARVDGPRGHNSHRPIILEREIIILSQFNIVF